MPMNLAVKEKWLAALRNGEYPQTRARLRELDEGASFAEIADAIEEQW